MTSRRARFLKMVFWLAVMATLALALSPYPPQLAAVNDKVQHIMAFAVLSLLLTVAFDKLGLLSQFVAMAGLGAIIELLQLIPGLHRDAEIADWLADCAASLVILCLCAAIRSRLAVALPAGPDLE